MNISLQNISYTYDSSSVLALDKVSLTLPSGWTGIVGENGSGKTTLLSILCGLVKPDEGQIVPPVTGVYCAQSTEEPPPTMQEFACDYSRTSIRLRAQLQIEEDWFWRYETLSHGERKRVQIASALFLEPQIIALDEPTNHLDAQTKRTLLKTLQSYQGVGIIVSHDRFFLDKLVTQCVFMTAGKAVSIPGTYSEAKAQSEIIHQTKVAERKNARENLERLHQEGNRRKVEASRSSARRSARHLDKHDSDGRAKIRLAVYTGQDGKTGLLSAQMGKKLEDAKERLDAAFVEKKYDKPLVLRAEKSHRKVLFTMKAGSIPLGDLRSLSFPDLYIGNEDRIGLIGENGAGKSTLLSHIMKHISQKESILYIPQELSGEEGRRLLARIKKLSQEELGEVLSIVARLNSPPTRVLYGDNLSPGEMRKIMLAEGLLHHPELIVMDEPTNHLDIHSIEALQDVLSSCECSLVLVSHDQTFIEQLTNIRWNFVSAHEENEANETNEDKGEKDQISFNEMKVKVQLV